jgi:hypothetical protein
MVVALCCVHGNKDVSVTTYVLGIEGGSGVVPAERGILHINTAFGKSSCCLGSLAPPGQYAH